MSPPSPFASKSGGHDHPSSYGSAAPAPSIAYALLILGVSLYSDNKSIGENASLISE